MHYVTRMLNTLAKKLFGSANDRLVKSLQKTVDRINAIEPEIARLSDAELQGKTQWFRERLTGKETLDDLLPEAFAVVREASKRVLGMRHFDVQLIGGMVLHKGMISEMKTGEGKTLMATLPVYLNALSGKGVHVVTVNDYLAQRDAAWMGKLYSFLGLSTGVIVHGVEDSERQAAYACDITYGTNNEFGFDYLRDNMKYMRESMVHRPFNYAIVDEVDSILVDEARTPLIISGPTEDNSELYTQIDKLLPSLQTGSPEAAAAFVEAQSATHPDLMKALLRATKLADRKTQLQELNALKYKSAPEDAAIVMQYLDTLYGDYEIDEKSKAVSLTEKGVAVMEALLVKTGMLQENESLYDINHVAVVHHVNQALRAHKLFARDVDYIVHENKVVIIDEFTGRMMEGRRFSEGLHQALEAKERVKIQNENQTLASITFQNYFRMYPKLAGMTGTAMTEATEFMDIYKLEVVEIPTNLPVSRIDDHDEIYRTSKERYDAVIELIKECHKKGQPVLVGTVSIEKSEYLSGLLKKQKVPHQVLNARHHEREAFIVAQAGRLGAVTIATNMAGRGTDIVLGGNAEMMALEQGAEGQLEKLKAQCAAEKEKVIAAGGLYVVGTERHESRRIDNQLRGRSGRQGDPGASKFYLSLEDDLMRIFGSERIDGMLQRLGLKEGEAIFHPWMNKAIEKAQGKVESRNYDIRKNLLKFDDVMNDQRKVVFEQRLEMMDETDLSDVIAEMRKDVMQQMVELHIPPKSYPEQWEAESLEKEAFRVFGMHLPITAWAQEEGIADQEILTRLTAAVEEMMAQKEADFMPELMRHVEKRVLLQTLDELWKDHLYQLDHLRQGIHLRGYAQRDPLNEYKLEAFGMFEVMLNGLRGLVTERLAHLAVSPMTADPASVGIQAMPTPPRMMVESREDPAFSESPMPNPQSPVQTHVKPEDRNPSNPTTWGKVARNEDCPCESGKKYKHCHGSFS
jgi:preprotein translocase subunit SecA